VKGRVVRRDEIALNQTAWGGLRNLFAGTLLDPASAFSFGLISYRKPHHSGRHADHEVIYVLRGKGIARIGNERVPFTPGTLLVIPKNTEHGIEKVHGSGVSAVIAHFL
jgi:quercetin dioxygenase-like cupin family protein